MGDSDDIGSWKIIAISRPRIARIWRPRGLRLVRSIEPPFGWLNVIEPPAMRPGASTICRIERAVTDLPDPLSPTTQSVLPGSIAKDRSLTARKTPVRSGNSTVRFFTSSSGLPAMETISVMPASFVIGVSRIAQAVAEEIERHDGNHDGAARQEEPGRRGDRADVLGLSQQHAPGDGRRLQP